MNDTARVLAVAPEREVPTVITPLEMLNNAVTSGASMEVLERLMALHERWEANQARKAFDEAISNAKAEITPIARNAKGHNDKKYADFSAIARMVDPIISKFGLSYRFRSAQADRISVTCVLSHKLGHSEETTLSGPPDKTGSKNDIQAIGSTLTYLQRYSLVQALGLAAANDDDGAGAKDDELITADQAKELDALIVAGKTDLAKFLKWAKADSVPDIKAKYFEDCKSKLELRANAKATAS